MAGGRVHGARRHQGSTLASGRPGRPIEALTHPKMPACDLGRMALSTLGRTLTKRAGVRQTRSSTRPCDRYRQPSAAVQSRVARGAWRVARGAQTCTTFEGASASVNVGGTRIWCSSARLRPAKGTSRAKTAPLLGRSLGRFHRRDAFSTMPFATRNPAQASRRYCSIVMLAPNALIAFACATPT